jgi:ParB family transcriptional regulator, chromosome partitioning protein
MKTAVAAEERPRAREDGRLLEKEFQMKRWLKALTSDAGEHHQVVAIEMNQIKLREGHGPLNKANVEQLVKSIDQVGLLHPLYVTASEQCYLLLWGHHRFAACEILGFQNVPCFIVEGDELLLELAQVQENLSRSELGPSDRARLTLREKKILQHLANQRAEDASQSATSSERVAGSIRDHAEKTGKHKDKVHRALKRGEALGEDILKKTVHTSLDKDVELDALAKLPPDERARLVDMAASGEIVSARTPDGKPTARKPARNTLEPRAKAQSDFRRWIEENPCVGTIPLLEKPIADIMTALSDDPERSRSA